MDMHLMPNFAQIGKGRWAQYAPNLKIWLKIKIAIFQHFCPSGVTH